MMKKKEDVAARTLQRAWKSYKTQKNLRNITQLAKLLKNQEEAEMSARKDNSVVTLGRRLSGALTKFFGMSRPVSAVSRSSIKTGTHSGWVKVSSNTLKVPSVGALYPSHGDDPDINL
jgi:hypothetical protein